MAFATKTALDAVVALVTGLTGVQQVYKGAPENISNRVSAYVALGSQKVYDKAGGLLQREQSYFIGFAYRVAGAEATAEDTVADLVDAFITAFYADRTLGGVLAQGVLDLSLSSQPEYQIVAGQEFRIFPILITGSQQANT